MARRLTTFSKLLITFLILASIFFGGKWVLDNTGIGQTIKDQTQQAQEGASSSTTNNSNNNSTSTNSGSTSSSNTSGSSNASAEVDENTLRVQLVSWGGYAPGLYFNEGAQANLRSRFYKEYGVKVDFKLENDLINAMNAWIADEYDVIVQTADAFPLYTAPDDINAYKPKAFIQVDWSRGGDAIIVKRGINSVNDLKGKKIAVAVPSPAQTLLITSLEAAGMSYSDVSVVKTSDNLKAAELFRSGDIDAAVVWSPDDQLATRDVPGSKILLTTVDQSHVIADIMLAKEDVINKKRKLFQGFYEGWMKGVSELNNPSNQKKAAKYLAELNGVSVDDALGMMSVVKWTSHGDNMNFFGLNANYKGQKGQDLYSKMAGNFVKTGDAEKVAPNWRTVINTSSIMAADSKLKGALYKAEKSKVFTPASPKAKTAPAVAMKPVKINFETGAFRLSENAKTIIDLEFADVAKAFGNARIRVEGNTDNVGNRANNMTLSQKRAQSVVDYLKGQYGMDTNKFIVVGNGPDKPVKGCETNATSSCKAKNRRTEFQLIAN